MTQVIRFNRSREMAERVQQHVPQARVAMGDNSRYRQP